MKAIATVECHKHAKSHAEASDVNQSRLSLHMLFHEE